MLWAVGRLPKIRDFKTKHGPIKTPLVNSTKNSGIALHCIAFPLLIKSKINNNTSPIIIVIIILDQCTLFIKHQRPQ